MRSENTRPDVTISFLAVMVEPGEVARELEALEGCLGWANEKQAIIEDIQVKFTNISKKINKQLESLIASS